jgi:methylmalonyl-CoA mutase
MDLQIAGLGLESGAAFLPIAAQVVALAQKRGSGADKLQLAFNADPLAVLAREGRLPYSLEHGLNQLADLATWTDNNLPHSTAVRVGTAPYHHAGATAAQDLGFSMATALAYLRAMTSSGMSLQAASGQLLFSYGLGCNMFLAIAKLRAARKLYARVIEACGGTQEEARMRMHVKTSRRVITARDPWVNLLRNTVTCFAGAVAGAEIITTYPFDSAIGLPSELSRRIARNTQVILQEESHLNTVVDPAGGCWLVEKVTDELAEKAWAQLQAVEAQGGMPQAILSGYIREQIEEAFTPRLKNIARRRDAITGVSEFPNLSEEPIHPPKVDLGTIQDDAAKRLRSRGGNPQPAIDALAKAAGTAHGGALTDLAIQAAAEGARVGQLASGLWPAQEPLRIAPIHPHPYAEAFEQLRDAADDYEHLTGERPKVFLVNLGPLAEHNARQGYAQNFFQAGGFEVIPSPPLEDAEQAVEAFAQSGANIAVICSSDQRYQQQVPQVAPALKRVGARTVILAGAPGEHEQTYTAAGVDRFIYVRCDVLQTLRELLQEEGALS